MSDGQFAAIEKRLRKFRGHGTARLSRQTREELREHLEFYCLRRFMVEGAVSTSEAKKVFKAMQSAAEKARLQFTKFYAHPQYMVLAAYSDKYIGNTLDETMSRLAGVEAACHRALKDIALQTKPGRQDDEALTALVWNLALLFRDKFGEPTTHFNSSKAARVTPFMEFVRELYACLPASERPLGARELEERVDRVVKKVKRHSGRNGPAGRKISTEKPR